MRRTILLLLFVVLTGPAPAAPPEVSCTCGRDYADVLARVLPSVVNLSVIKIEALNPSGGEAAAHRSRFFGSGFVIDPSGIIVTNRHVIQGAVAITASFADKTQARAHLIAGGHLVDLAVLKVDVSRKLPALAFADSDKLRIGDLVLAIGNPYGLGTSVSHGIISGLNRNLNQTPFDDDIQTDAAINPGNSGGPMVNMQGQVVGVDTALYTRTGGGDIGIGYAIPSNDVAFVVKHLLDPHLPVAGWIGITGQDVTPEIAKAFALPRIGGVIVKAADPSGPARQAGLRPGDVVLAVDSVMPADTRELIRSIVKMTPGQSIELGLWRNRGPLTAKVIVGGWPDLSSSRANTMAPPSIAEIAPSPDLGMGLAAISDAGRERYKLPPDQTGALVVLVTNGTEASERDIQPGDVITNIDGVPVTSPADVERLLGEAIVEQRQYLAFLILSKDGLRWETFYTGTARSS
jgi:serine protease Do